MMRIGLAAAKAGSVSRPSAERRGRAVVASLLVLMVVLLLAGCGGSSTTEDLEMVLRQTRTAVGSTELAVEQYDHGQLTRAAAEVTVADMADQVGLAQRQLVDVPAATAEQRELRRQCHRVVSDALATVQNTEDTFADPASRAAATADLSRVQSAVDALLSAVTKR